MKNNHCKGKILYIIGNGFDLHHGLETSYDDFKCFLKIKESSVIKQFEELLYCKGYIEKKNETWSNLETWTRGLYEVDMEDRP